MKRVITTSAVLALLLVAPAAHGQDTFTYEAPAGDNAVVLRIDSVTDASAIAPVIRAFQRREPNVTIIYRDFKTNELAAMAKRACQARQSSADIILSSAIDQQVKLVNDGCAQRLDSPVLRALPDWARWRDELFGLTYEAAVIVYSKQHFGAAKVPADRFDLVDMLRNSDELNGRVGTYDLEASGVGYLFASQDALQASTFGRLVEALGRNGVQLFCCSGDILDRIVSGELLLGYNVLGSYAMSRARDNPDIGIVLPSDYTLVMARAAYVPKSSGQAALAQRFLEFIFSPDGQQVMSQAALLLSPLSGAERLPRLVGADDKAQQSLRPIVFSPALMVGLDRVKRQLFLDQWRSSVKQNQSGF